MEISEGIFSTEIVCFSHLSSIPSHSDTFCDENGKNGCSKFAMFAIK